MAIMYKCTLWDVRNEVRSEASGFLTTLPHVAGEARCLIADGLPSVRSLTLR